MIEFEVRPTQIDVDGCDDGYKQKETRYVIVEKGTEKILDDAQGYGYKTAQGAHKAGWFKFKGGKEKTLTNLENSLHFWNRYPEAARKFESILEMDCKWIAMGEYSMEDVAISVEKEFNIVIPRDILKNLDMLDSGYRKNWNKIKKKKFKGIKPPHNLIQNFHQ